MNTRKYRQEVWQDALLHARKRIDAKIDALRTFLGILVLVFILIILAMLGIWRDICSIPTYIWGLFGASILAILVTPVSVYIVAFFDMWNAAARRDHNQKEHIRELEPDDPFQFVLKPPFRLENRIVWVGIDIYNNSTHSVNCSVSVRTKTMQRPNVLNRLSNNMQSHSQNPFEITRNTNLPFYFACSSKGWPNAVLNTQDDAERRIYPGSHELSIIINGENSKGKPVSHSEDFILIVGSDDKIELASKDAAEPFAVARG